MIFEVIVDISNSEVDRIFDYRSPFPVEVGDRVLVPFGSRQIEGYIVGTKSRASGKYEIKNIIKKLDDFTTLTKEMIELSKFMATQNLRYVDCLRLFVPSSLRKGKAKIRKQHILRINEKFLDENDLLKEIGQNAKAQLALAKYMLVEIEDLEVNIKKLYSPSVIKNLVDKGVLVRSSIHSHRTPRSMKIDDKEVELTPEQKIAFTTIMSPKNAFLVHGVTGSGKTELYMRVIEQVLAQGKTAIMLVPEISLTPQMLGVFRGRFGDQVSLLHSNLSHGERLDEWTKLRMGISRIALGPRSAIFAPLENVGVIIVDEEHDTSYVSESNPRYFTIDIARFRTKYNGAKLILGSATPSIESYYRSMEGEYELISMPNRINNRCLPEMETIDMRRELKAGNLSIFSARLLSAIEDSLNRKEQVMLFLNRRGYSSFVRCGQCGFIPLCPSCDVSLTQHLEDNSLRCHFCGNKYLMIDECPKCGNKNLKEGRVGTEKLVEELNRIFPEKVVLRMDLDTTSTKDGYLKILNDFNDFKGDILVGTQMIAKGHDFKNVTLVGVIDADISLFVQDFRANEKTFQLITQVAGRAGRDAKPGKVFIQTYVPNNEVYGYTARYDYKGFYEREIRRRQGTRFPPFSKIIRVLVQSPKNELAKAANDRIYSILKGAIGEKEGVIRMQASVAPLKKKGGYFRHQVVIWLDISVADALLKEIYPLVRSLKRKNVTVFSEINPQQII